MTLTQHLDWKFGKFVEWCTYLPYVDHPQISPDFVVRNIDCYFLLSRKTGTDYYFYLMPKSEGTKLEPFSLTFYVQYPGYTASNVYKKEFTDSDTYLLCFPESCFTTKSLNLSHGLCVRFLFALEQNVELCLTSERKVEDKSIQAPLYIDSQFSLDGSSEDFAKLLADGPNHDVEFAFGDQTIKAHKNILCCRSNVFTSMFQTDMVEGGTGRVNIQDMDATVFQQFLWCLYTGKLPELTVDIAVQLYAASDKYAVNTLKLQFTHFLIDNLSLENACEVLVLADRHNDPEFKKSVMEYVFKEKIPVGEKWAEFCKENQQLAMEVLNSFCQYICQNQNPPRFCNCSCKENQ